MVITVAAGDAGARGREREHGGGGCEEAGRVVQKRKEEKEWKRETETTSQMDGIDAGCTYNDCKIASDIFFIIRDLPSYGTAVPVGVVYVKGKVDVVVVSGGGGGGGGGGAGAGA